MAIQFPVVTRISSSISPLKSRAQNAFCEIKTRMISERLQDDPKVIDGKWYETKKLLRDVEVESLNGGACASYREIFPGARISLWIRGSRVIERRAGVFEWTLAPTEVAFESGKKRLIQITKVSRNCFDSSRRQRICDEWSEVH